MGPSSMNDAFRPKVCIFALAVASLLVLGLSGCGGSTTSSNVTPPCTVNCTPDYTISTSPGSISVGAGASGTTVITVSGTNSFSGSVSLAASGLPTGVTASFSPTATTGTSTLTLATTSAATAGTSTVTITGTSGALTHIATVALTVTVPNPLDTYKLTGDVGFIHDPSIIRQGSIYYAFTTDPGDGVVANNPGLLNGLQIRTSFDKVNWKIRDRIFNQVPSYVSAFFTPNNFDDFWAPDISYFNGLYHVYYTASGFGGNHSLIGLATTPTLDNTDPSYKWTDRGMVLSSQLTDNYNAIDANILVDTDANGALTHVWMQYGSFWGGIYQREIDPVTGLLSTSNTAVINLASRPSVTNDPIEGASLVKKNGFYYLFASFDYCCSNPITNANYKIAVGRSSSANGPFADQAGVLMTQGGGTILLQGDAAFSAPGGETIFIDPSGSGDLITFHALKTTQNYLDYLFVNGITWTGGWPQIVP